MQTIVAPLATPAETSHGEVTGGTHVPSSPSYHYLARHWAAAVARLGLRAQFELVRAGFYPPGGGEIRAEVSPWPRPASLRLEDRGALVEIIGTSGAGKVKNDVAQRQAEAARERLWKRAGSRAVGTSSRCSALARILPPPQAVRE
jgi:RNA 3'-terminal phosphate cyclase (ATP)